MEAKKKGKFANFMKNYGTILISGGLIIAIAITLMIVGLSPSPSNITDNYVDNNIEQTPVVNEDVARYVCPMNNASVIKDFSIQELQYNQTLNCWEAHLSVDLMSVDTEVMAVYNGEVTGIENDFLMGNVVTITHENGLVSVYASLDENLQVQVGDKVTAGQVIGYAGATATSEVADGVHLDFAMLLNGEEIDPNNYINLQNK